MADETTANYGWEKPDVAADDGTWGDILNTGLDNIDNDLKVVQNSIGLVYISSGTATAAAMVDVTIPAGYRGYHLVAVGVKPSTTANLGIQLNGGSGFDTTTNNYSLEAWQTGEAAPAYSSAQTGSSIKASRAQNSGTGGTFWIDLTNGPRASISGRSIYPGTTVNNGNQEASRFMADSQSIASATTLRLLFSTGTISVTKWALYGYANS